jgi:MFS family permease
LLKGWILGVLKLGTYWTCYIWLPKFLQDQLHQPIGRSALWILTAQLGQLLGMVAFGHVADRFGRRRAFTAFSVLTAAALYPLAFHWPWLLPRPVLFWAVLFALGLGSGCTAGFGALLAELFPTRIRNFAMGTTYNCARGVQFFAPLVVALFVSAYGLAGGLGVPLVLALATACWVWTLPETCARDLARVNGHDEGQESGGPGCRPGAGAARGLMRADGPTLPVVPRCRSDQRFSGGR